MWQFCRFYKRYRTERSDYAIIVFLRVSSFWWSQLFTMLERVKLTFIIKEENILLQKGRPRLVLFPCWKGIWETLDSPQTLTLFRPACRSGDKCFCCKKIKRYTRAKEYVAPDLKVGLHSLRASGATAAANAEGVSERCLKRYGGWKSDLAKDSYIDDSLSKMLIIWTLSILCSSVLSLVLFTATRCCVLYLYWSCVKTYDHLFTKWRKQPLFLITDHSALKFD